MLSNREFEIAVTRYNPDLWLRVKNNINDLAQIMFKGKSLGGCPRNYFSIEDNFVNGSLKHRGLKNIALILWADEVRKPDRFDQLLEDFGIKGLDKAMVMAKATNDPDYFNFLPGEFHFYGRLERMGILGTNRIKLLDLLHKNKESYQIEDSKLRMYVNEIIPA